GQGTTHGGFPDNVSGARGGPNPAARREAPGAKEGHRRPMSTQWRCAVCEAMNQGGDTCAACGAKVTQTVVQAPPAEPTPAPRRPQAPQRTQDDGSATEVPVRELPRRRLEPDRPDDGPYDMYDLFPLPPADNAPTYHRYQPLHTPPR